MAFTHSCYITKNTVELRKKLENLGYKYCGSECKSNLLPSIYCNQGTYYECIRKPSRYHSIIDCGTHEELFLALAALRDDTDKHQWFIYDSMDCKIEQLRDRFWFKCEEDKVQDHMFYDCMFLNCKKATVKEIIEHFLGK